MSDLQCAARLLLVSAEAVADDWLRSERVALVYDGRGDRTTQAAAALAESLQVTVRALERPVTRDEVTAQTPRVMETLQGVADVHRGETVVLVLPGVAEPVEVLIDGDGVVVRDPTAR